MGGNLTTVPELFRQASSTAFVDAKDAPTLFFNGTKDELVPLAWSEACYNALKECGVRTEMVTIEDAGHMGAASDRKALEKAYAFLRSELKNTGSVETEGDTETSPASEVSNTTPAPQDDADKDD